MIRLNHIIYQKDMAIMSFFQNHLCIFIINTEMIVLKNYYKLNY